MTLLSSAWSKQRAPEVLPPGVLRRLLARWDARVAFGIAVVVGLVAVAGPWFTVDPNLPDYADQLAAPDGAHLLGTDNAGRDLLARTVHGARTSLGAALLVTAVTATAGLLVGVLAGCVGGIVDTVLSRLIDILLGLPGLIVTLAVVGLLGPGLVNLMLAMSATGWAALARLARAAARSAMHGADVRAARMAGASGPRAAVEHVLPGVAAQVGVVATLGLGEVVVALAGLSFLGLGAQPPDAEWGTMLAEARQTLAYAPWQVVGPGVGLVLTVLAAVLLSEALRDVADPRATS